MRRALNSLVFLALLVPAVAGAQLVVPSEDWDGSLTITTDTTIDLAQAADGVWSTLPTDPQWSSGDGIYDAGQWALVFHYTDVTIDAGATLDFGNHPSGAPVIWVISGDVTVEGTIDLNGGTGDFDGYPVEGGPGGFRGGNGSSLGVPRGRGFGPGGAAEGAGNDGSYGSVGAGGAPTYGSDEIIPLIGGSGGSGYVASGGSGGGAIAIVCGGTVTINGEILAQGGIAADNSAGRGSGGGIRIVANLVTGTGTLDAAGGDQNAGVGRIRLENVSYPSPLGQVFPAASVQSLSPGSSAQVFPASTDPLLRIVSLNGVSVPADPQATLGFPWQDVALDGGNGDVTVVLEGTNVPATSTVNVFLTEFGGAGVAPTPATFVSVAGNLSTWEITLSSVDNGISAIQARAILP